MRGTEERERNAETFGPCNHTARSRSLLFYLRGTLQNRIYLRFGFGISAKSTEPSNQRFGKAGGAVISENKP